jgi:hypothetical protein
MTASADGSSILLVHPTDPVAFLLLGCIGSVQPSAMAFVRFTVFLHHFE